MADLYYYWIENIHESKSLSAQASLKDHAVGFVEWGVKEGFQKTTRTDTVIWRHKNGNTTHTTEQVYDLWPEREQSKQ